MPGFCACLFLNAIGPAAAPLCRRGVGGPSSNANELKVSLRLDCAYMQSLRFATAYPYHACVYDGLVMPTFADMRFCAVPLGSVTARDYSKCKHGAGGRVVSAHAPYLHARPSDVGLCPGRACGPEQFWPSLLAFAPACPPLASPYAQRRRSFLAIAKPM